MATEMPHKFKIGQIVFYRPKQRMLSASRGTYTVTGLMPAPADQQPEYRIRHFTEEFERVAFEDELSAGESERGQASKSQGMTLSPDDPLAKARRRRSAERSRTE